MDAHSILSRNSGGMAACLCCKSSNAQFGPPPKAPDGLPVKVTVCSICSKHLGHDERTAQRREKDHYDQYLYDLDEKERVLELKYEREIAALEARVRQLQDDLETRPTKIVHQNLDQEIVWAADIERQRAFTARDAAFRLLAQLRVLHHDTGRGTCSCRKPVGRCEETKVMDSSTAYRRWEAREGEAHRKGYDTQLPPEHPFRTNPRWSQPAA
jgi:hypothetical protein